MIKHIAIFSFLMGIVLQVSAQDAGRFKVEIDTILARSAHYDHKDLILFTGSSSIRMWRNLHRSFREHNVVNHGFGGSQMSDLLFYIDELVLRHHPSKVFIYEGDNDINAGKSAKEVIIDAEKVLTQIRSSFPDIPVYFIAAKPSVSRWSLQEKYVVFNKALEEWTKGQAHTHFTDIWTPMLTDGEVRRELFRRDSLHMNKTGYKIWTDVIGPLVK